MSSDDDHDKEFEHDTTNDVDVDANNNTNAAAADAGDKDNITNRKRRLSKRERKNLKKKKPNPQPPHTQQQQKKEERKDDNPKKKNEAPKAADTSTVVKVVEVEPTHEEYMQNYIPAPTVKVAEETNVDSKSLGKWFPKASVIKSNVCYSNDYLVMLAKERKKQQQQHQQQQQKGKGDNTKKKKTDNDNEKNKNKATTNNIQEQQQTKQQIKEPKASLVLFYQYVNPPWSESQVSSLMTYLTNIAKTHRTNIGGRIRVSTEGMNATVSAASTQITTGDDTNDDDDVDPKFEAAQTLRHFTRDLQKFDPVGFANTDFKYIDDLSADRHFKELKLIPVKELVFYGIRDKDCAVDASTSFGEGVIGGGNAGAAAGGEGAAAGGVPGAKEIRGGIHLDAKDYHEMLKQKNTVVIDVRNHYEAAIGRFDGQMEDGVVDAAEGKKERSNETAKKNEAASESERKEGDANIEACGGAEYIDPKMRKSTDFTSWLAEPQTKKKLEGKTVMMFCTGGIRCERASAYLNSQMGEKVKGVYQLQGGIERYLQAFPEGGFWRGKNFVFDKREAIGAGNINGDGGVVRKQGGDEGSKKVKKDDESGDNKLLSWGTECAKCHKPWDRYVGKRKCYTCGVPVLLCDGCMSLSSSNKKKKKKKPKEGADKSGKEVGGKEDGKSAEVERVRCPLCVEEGITVPAEEVEFTDNGIRGRCRASSFSESGIEDTFGAVAIDAEKQKHANMDKGDSKITEGKAAKSVLKWGGGHAAKKKEKIKFSRRPCQFGVECFRKDCFFYHPERETKSK